jgi:hypothetical protein
MIRGRTYHTRAEFYEQCSNHAEGRGQHADVIKVVTEFMVGMWA